MQENNSGAEEAPSSICPASGGAHDTCSAAAAAEQAAHHGASDVLGDAASRQSAAGQVRGVAELVAAGESEGVSDGQAQSDSYFSHWLAHNA